MSLYDDFDVKGKTTEKVADWSSGIKLLQSQLQLKKAATTQPKRDLQRKFTQILPPVVDLKSKKDDDDNIFSIHSAPIIAHAQKNTLFGKPILNVKDYDWELLGEYDPSKPNDYEKFVRELRDQRDRESDKRFEERERRVHEKRKSSRFNEESEMPDRISRNTEEDERPSPSERPRTGGVAIAPPPSLVEAGPPSPPASTSPAPPEKPGFSVGGYGGNSVAAKIMAKYGFKEGQGLGKKEQGMSMALQVEKTSKRGGRIIHEKDANMPPPPPMVYSPQPAPLAEPSLVVNDLQNKPEPSITEIMKSPSKVVLLRNMVGPGDVDDDLEPEVKDECNTKYGDVIKVVIFEIPGAAADEAVRIFVEFKRIESAIKAVVDLNGRFFGGRQVKAGFYSTQKFASLQLLD